MMPGVRMTRRFALRSLDIDGIVMMGNLYIASGGRGDPAGNCRNVLRSLSEAAERRASCGTPWGTKRVLLRPVGEHWRLRVTIGGLEVHASDLCQVTTASPLASVQLAAAARALRVVHTRSTKPSWRQVGDTWTAVLE